MSPAVPLVLYTGLASQTIGGMNSKGLFANEYNFS